MKGENRGEMKGGDEILRVPINRGFVRVEGGDEGFFQ